MNIFFYLRRMANSTKKAVSVPTPSPALSKVQVRTISGLNPTAQTKTLCGSGKASNAKENRLWEVCAVLKERNRLLHVIMFLQLNYGLRISEVLAIRWEHYCRGYKLLVPGSKRSYDRYLSVFELGWFFGTPGSKVGYCFPGISRFYVYREYKKIGCEGYFGSNVKASVTHLPRHYVLLNAKNSGIDSEVSKSFIGHKSIKSTNHYEQSKERANRD